MQKMEREEKNEIIKSAGGWRCETFNADTERNGTHAAIIFVFKGTVSFQFCRRQMSVRSVAYTTGYLFIFFFFSLFPQNY